MGKVSSKHALLVADLVAIAVGFKVAYWLRIGLLGFFPSVEPPSFGVYWEAILLALGIWVLLFRALQMDHFNEGLGLPAAIPRLFAAVMLWLVCLLAGSYLAQKYYSRLLLALLGLLLVVFLLATRLIYQAALKWLRRYKVGLRRVVIVGDSELAREIADRVRRHQELRYELVGFLSPATSRLVGGSKPGEMVGGTEGIVRELLNKRVDELIFTIPIRRDTETLDLIARCQKLGIEIKLIPEYYQLHVSQLRSFSVDGIPVLELKETTMGWPHRVVKLVMDYSVAVLLLAVLGPLVLVLSLLLYIARRGRVIKREIRVGLDGRQFLLYRFNATPDDFEPSVPAWGARLCRFLHRYSLSELPQLWNVIKGDMSLVGPRPETPERVRHYSAWHRRRLNLKPGITGLAQVKGIRDYDSLDEKTKYDLEYAANFSPFLDLTLTLATPGTLLRRRKSTVFVKPASGLASDGTLQSSSM